MTLACCEALSHLRDSTPCKCCAPPRQVCAVGQVRSIRFMPPPPGYPAAPPHARTFPAGAWRRSGSGGNSPRPRPAEAVSETGRNQDGLNRRSRSGDRSFALVQRMHPATFAMAAPDQAPMAGTGCALSSAFGAKAAFRLRAVRGAGQKPDRGVSRYHVDRVHSGYEFIRAMTGAGRAPMTGAPLSCRSRSGRLKAFQSSPVPG